MGEREIESIRRQQQQQQRTLHVVVVDKHIKIKIQLVVNQRKIKKKTCLSSAQSQ